MNNFLIGIRLFFQSIVDFFRTPPAPVVPSKPALSGPSPDTSIEVGIPAPSRDTGSEDTNPFLTEFLKRRYRVGHMIVKWEARLDAQGRPKLYELPSGDGGGKYEISGINSKYHPEALERIRKAEPEDRRQMCAEYIDDYTRRGTGLHWMSSGLRAGTELAVLDCAFNRGPGGAARICQTALKAMKFPVSVDGAWGPQTRGFLKEADSRGFPIVQEIRKAREQYERRNRDESSKFWNGLVNRWDKVTAESALWNKHEARTQKDLPAVSEEAETPDSIPEWYKLAEKEIGQKEIKGPKHNQRIVDYWRDAELSFNDDEVPWCAGFVGAMLEREGIDGTASGMARSYERNWGVKISKPTVGCVVVFYRGKRSDGFGHVGFYAGHDDNNNVMVLGGNQADAVNIKPFSRTRLIGFYWPKGEPLPSTHVDPLLTSDGKLSTNEA